MPRRLLFLVLIFCVLFTIIHSKSECSCSCCKGNRCIARHQGSIQMPTCSAQSCERTCKARYPVQCGRSPGSLTATCTKTKTRKPHRASPVKKIKQVLRPTSKTHIIRRRPY